MQLADYIAAHESAIGPKRTRRHSRLVSVIGGKADMALAGADRINHFIEALNPV